MPLHISVDLNRDRIDSLHIGRIEGGTDPDDINTYVVVQGDQPLFYEQWIERGVQYKHRYGDGALTCVRKAIEALEKRDAPIELKVDLSRSGHHCGYDFEIWKPTAVCECGAVATNPFYVRDGNDQI